MMERKRILNMISPRQRKDNRGSIIIYILIAIFLTGLLVAAMSQGAKKSASSEQIDEVMMYMQTDIQAVQANITECVVSYQNNNFCPPNSSGPGLSCQDEFQTQDGGNPNVPFPLYHDLTSGGSGDALVNSTATTSIMCPRAPAAQQQIFTKSITQSLKLLQDTSNYTTTYFTNGSEGVYLRITRTLSDPIWTEAITRLNNKYTACSVAYVAPGGTDPTGYTCTYGCLYYWILRRSTSNASWKAGCP
jgi:hypothetical protein